jgi:hypothetical protein
MAGHALPDISDLWDDATRTKYLKDCEESGADVRYSADASGINREAYAKAYNKLTGEARERFRKNHPYIRFDEPCTDVVDSILAGNFTMARYLQVGDMYVCDREWKKAVHKKIATGRLALLSVDAVPSIYKIEPPDYPEGWDVEILLATTKAGVTHAMRRVLDTAALALRTLDDLEVEPWALDLARAAPSLDHFVGAALHVHFIVQGRYGRSRPYRAFPDEVVLACHKVVPGSASFIRAIATVSRARELAKATLEPIEDALLDAGTCPAVDLVDALSAYVSETIPGQRVVAVPGRKELLQGRMLYVDCELKLTHVL